MIQLPETLPYDAVSILLAAYKDKNRDWTEIAVASWNVIGYGLHLGLPRVVSNPIMQISDEACVSEIESFLVDADNPELKRGILTEAAIAFLIKLAIKYLLKGA